MLMMMMIFDEFCSTHVFLVFSTNIFNVPEHVVPFPVKPKIHWHVKDPCVFVHVADGSHGLPAVHSSISRFKNE